ncbi:hypothetical protein TNCV_748941 [Trichonephila clavipes]|nr:hypothetical protein TNCV_748941 [Trichonephila clavipes]
MKFHKEFRHLHLPTDGLVFSSSCDVPAPLRSTSSISKKMPSITAETRASLNDDDILESIDITKDLETVDSEPEEDVTPLLSGILFRLYNASSLITDYLEEKKSLKFLKKHYHVDLVILSSSDESDLAPIHKRVRLSDSE